MRGTRPGKAAIGGIRLPFESPGVGDGYCASGECITRQMTEAERQRYGKAEPSGKAPFVWRKKEDEMSRLDTAREKLSKEKYMELKKAGMLDGEIMRKNFGSVWTDVLNTLKKEWGLIGALPNPGNAKKKEEITQAVKIDVTTIDKQDEPEYINLTQPDLRTADDIIPEPDTLICDGLTTRKVSVMELLVEVEVLNNRMESDKKRIDYISGILEKTMVEV